MATSCERFRHLFAYEREAHGHVLNALQACPASARQHPAFQQAVDLLAHVAAARRMWLARMGISSERVSPQELEPQNVSLSELSTRLEAAEQAWADYLARLDPGELSRNVEYKSYDSGSFRNTVEEILTQLYGHSHYHRGQIALLMRQAGGRAAPTDYILWVRQAL